MLGSPPSQDPGGSELAGAVETLPRRVCLLCARELSEVPTHVERQLATIEYLTAQIRAADVELAAIAKADAVCHRLMSVPGVGPVTAVRFVAAFDGAVRFPARSRRGIVSRSGRALELGPTAPYRHYQSGAPQVRWALVQAALRARRRRR